MDYVVINYENEPNQTQACRSPLGHMRQAKIGNTFSKKRSLFSNFSVHFLRIFSIFYAFLRTSTTVIDQYSW